MGDEKCGFAVIDGTGEQEPCDRPATGWRWYQDCEHEDALDVACEMHENEGGRRIAAAEGRVARVEVLTARWESEGAERGPDDRIYAAGTAAMLRAALDDSSNESAGGRA